MGIFREEVGRGQLYINTKDIMTKWEYYFYDLLIIEDDEQRNKADGSQEQTNEIQRTDNMENKITDIELDKALRKLKIGKEAGVIEVDA